MSENEYPVHYLTQKDEHWRWGVEESELDGCLQFFYQDNDSKTGDWAKRTSFEICVDVPNWEEIKRSATALFAFLAGKDCIQDGPYSSPEFKIFDKESYSCLVVTESADCPGCLELDTMDYKREWKVYKSCDNQFGSFNKDEWEGFVAVVDKFIAEVF